MYRGGSKQALSRLAPGILEVCEGAKDSAMYSGDSLEVETSVNSFGIGNPGSLRGCQRQSQTGARNSRDSLE